MGRVERLRRVPPPVAQLQVVLLSLAVAALFAAQGEALLARPGLVLRLLVPLLAFFAVAYLLAQAAARLLRLGYESRAALTTVTTARNSPIALAVAVAASPDRPLIESLPASGGSGVRKGQRARPLLPRPRR